jgi:hypothetical protein
MAGFTDPRRRARRRIRPKQGAPTRPGDDAGPAAVPVPARFRLYGHDLELHLWPHGTTDPGDPDAHRLECGLWVRFRFTSPRTAINHPTG